MKCGGEWVSVLQTHRHACTRAHILARLCPSTICKHNINLQFIFYSRPTPVLPQYKLFHICCIRHIDGSVMYRPPGCSRRRRVNDCRISMNGLTEGLGVNMD